MATTYSQVIQDPVYHQVYENQVFKVQKNNIQIEDQNKKLSEEVHNHQQNYAHLLQVESKSKRNLNSQSYQDDYKQKIQEKQDKIDSLLIPKIFNAKFYNASNPNWEWTNWKKHGTILSITTDKPVYKPDDILQARVYFFNFTDKSPVDCSNFNPSFEIIDSSDKVIYTKDYEYNAKCTNSSKVLEYKIPKDMKGGVYYIKTSDYSQPPSKVKFRVREYQQKSLVIFDYSQESYNPGDQVEGKLTLKSVDNEPIPAASYFDVKTSAGESRSNLAIDSNGFGYFTFKVPNDWSDGTISVSYTIHVGDNASTKTDTITVVQKNTIAIEFTGESGKIVRNVCNKIYFEAFADSSKAEHVDISNAQILELKDNNTETLISSGVSTQFFGRGFFDICVQKNTKYVLRYKGIDHNIDIDQYNKDFDSQALNITETSVIKIKNPVVSNEDSIDLTISVSNPDEKRNVMLVFSQKTRTLYSKRIQISSKDTRVDISASMLNLTNGGVISVSLYDAMILDAVAEEYMYDLKTRFPYSILADRLMFVLPSKTLGVKLKTDKPSYSPGDTVNYEVTVYDRVTGTQVNNDVLVAVGVTDLSSFLEVENKKQPPSLVSKVYLEKEIKVTKEYEFLNANEFIDFMYQPDLSKAESIRKLELLLGTQKWRLFMFDPHYQSEYSSQLHGDDNNLMSYLLKNLLMGSSPQMYAMDNMVMMPMMAMAAMPENGIMKKGKAGGPRPVPMPNQRAAPLPTEVDEEDESSEENKSSSESNSKDEFTAERVNFKQTQLFTEFVVASHGQYKGSFKLSDVITKFRFSVDAVSPSGVYGSLIDSFSSIKDFYIESNVPFFLTSQDKINVPVIIHNNKNEDLTVNLAVSTTLKNNELDAVLVETSIAVSKKSTKSVILKLNAKKQTAGEFKIKIEAKSATGSDSFVKASKIIGRGFPVTKTQSGFIGTQGEDFKSDTFLKVSLPSTFEEGTLEVKAKIFTSQLSHIYEALERLIQDPYGCFEQTSSTTYPLVMALILMKNLPEKNDKVTQMMIEGKQKLQKGYERLLTFETSTGGYEWFGSSPGHEALTAYGLMQFNEMKEVLSSVDQTMIDRVTKWILDKRDGQGSFKMSQHGLDSFGSPPPQLSDAYILWVLTSVGQNAGLEKEIKAVIEKAKASGDSYLNALVANILYNVGRTEEARSISRILKSQQDANTGEVQRKETSITRSSGSSLNIETTALSILAWMKDSSGEFSSSVQLGINYIVASIKDGKYGSTQGTILSLKVLVEYLKNSKLDGKGTFDLLIDGYSIKSYKFDNTTNTSTLDFTTDANNYIKDHMSYFTKQSNHEIKIALNNFEGDQKKFRLSYSIDIHYKDLTPKSNPDSPLKMTLTASSDSEGAKVGDITTYNLTVKNKDADNGKGMLISMVRVPSCQEVSFNSLERLQSENKISYFEVLNANTDVVLYWRSMAPGESKQAQVVMTQVYTGDLCIYRPSKSYLYYDEDGSEVWSE